MVKKYTMMAYSAHLFHRYSLVLVVYHDGIQIKG